MMTPDDIDVWVRLDVGKGAHALDRDGDTLYDKPLKQDEKAIRSMLEHLSRRGRVLLVVDQPNTTGSLPLTVAQDMGIAVAYLPGTAMRRTVQLSPETLRDAGPDDETLAALKLLAGHDEDLANFKRPTWPPTPASLRSSAHGSPCSSLTKPSWTPANSWCWSLLPAAFSACSAKHHQFSPHRASSPSSVRPYPRPSRISPIRWTGNKQ